LWAWETLFPDIGRFPVTWHTLDILKLQKRAQKYGQTQKRGDSIGDFTRFQGYYAENGWKALSAVGIVHALV